ARSANSCDERRRSSEQNLLHPKKVGTLPVAGKEKEEAKRTNEIKTAIPLLEAIEIAGKEVSADALLTQRELADYLVTKRKAHYHIVGQLALRQQGIGTLFGHQAQGALPFHRQRQSAGSSGRFETLFPGSRGSAFRGAYAPGSRTSRNPKNLDHHGTERLPQLSSRGPSLRRRAARHEEKDWRKHSGHCLRHHQSDPPTSRPASGSQSQPRSLDD